LRLFIRLFACELICTKFLGKSIPLLQALVTIVSIFLHKISEELFLTPDFSAFTRSITFSMMVS
jgi:hypothetical protein